MVLLRPSGMLAEIDVVHDSAEARERLIAALAATAGRVCAFTSAEALLLECETGSPRCVVVAADLGGIGARGLIQAVRDRRLPACIVVLARSGDVASAAQLLRAGASDVVDASAPPQRLRAAVRQALADATSQSAPPDSEPRTT
jgi:FixJ family two-component response regulator